jgi:hypothetical protein
MNTWHIDTSVQLRLAEMKREDMIRAGLVRQHLLERRTKPSRIIALRLVMANALIGLGQAVKPATCGDEWTGSPRTAA